MNGAGRPSTMNGDVRTEQLVGVVVHWHGHWGFIQAPRRSSWFFVHTADCVGVEQLKPGQTVRFIPTPMSRGPRAVRVEVLAPAPTAAERSEK